MKEEHPLVPIQGFMDFDHRWILNKDNRPEKKKSEHIGECGQRLLSACMKLPKNKLI